MSKPTLELVTSDERKPTLTVRRGRGKSGGSTGCDFWIQRGRHHGRRVKPLDGDLRSKTLANLYPSHTMNGEPIKDSASSPVSEELVDMKAWLSAEFDSMVEHKISCVIDLGGGETVMAQHGRELDLQSFCKDFGIDLLSAYFLGPDVEDFLHVMEIAKTGDLNAERTMLVLNEGVIRHGETTVGAFQAIISHPDFAALLASGARMTIMPRLSCLPVLRERGLGYYETAAGGVTKTGQKVSPTIQHMTKTWIAKNENEYEQAGTKDWLP